MRRKAQNFVRKQRIELGEKVILPSNGQQLGTNNHLASDIKSKHRKSFLQHIKNFYSRKAQEALDSH